MPIQYLNAIILVFSGLGTFLSGSILRYRPLIVGGIVLWLSAFAANSVGFEYQNIVSAVGFAFGYLVPAYMLKKEENA